MSVSYLKFEYQLIQFQHCFFQMTLLWSYTNLVTYFMFHWNQFRVSVSWRGRVGNFPFLLFWLMAWLLQQSVLQYSPWLATNFTFKMTTTKVRQIHTPNPKNTADKLPKVSSKCFIYVWNCWEVESLSSYFGSTFSVVSVTVPQFPFVTAPWVFDENL